MAEELILVIQSRDEVGAVDGGCLRHERSMARIGADCKRWWTLAQASQLMEHLRFTYKNTVNLSGFVTLTLAEFVTPKQVTHGLLVDSEGYSLEFNLGSHGLVSA